MTDNLTLRTATPDDVDQIMSLLGRSFAEDVPEDQRVSEKMVFEPARDHVVVDGDEIVANAGAYTRDVTVPGGSVAAAHVTLVSVAPTYRRRGLLTRMMREQLDDVVRRGEPIATLWASEGAIYQRFGYGLAVSRFGCEMQAAQLRVNAPAAAEADAEGGRLRETTPQAARAEMEALYEEQRALRPGISSRPGRWWEARLRDPESARQGWTSRRAVLYQGPSAVDGYALWRVKSEWDAGGPKGVVRVEEIVTRTPQAYAALWRFLLSVDLTRSATYGFARVDEPLRYMVDEPRRIGGRVMDGLWLRIADLPAALEARRYATPVDVVLEVTDALLPANAGRWRLRSSGPDGPATCERTDGPAGLSMDVAALGAAYLAGTSLAVLADAGRVRAQSPGTLAAATAAFGWTHAPAAIEVF